MRTRRLLVVVVCGAGLLLAGLAISLTGPEAAQADPGIIYVDRDAPGPTHDGLSWTTAYTLLQSALDVAVYGDEIWVAEGVYTPTNVAGSNATFQLVSGVGLYGGFGGYGISETLRTQRDWTANVTVLSGDLDGNDGADPHGIITDTIQITGTNARHVVIGSGADETAVLDGFFITGGNANGEWPHNTGGGMYVSSGSPSLAHIVFMGNNATSSGGGIRISGGSLTIVGATFARNSASLAGGMACFGGAPKITNAVFSGNLGGGVYSDLGTPVLTNVTFSGNTSDSFGSAVRGRFSSPVLQNSIVWGNSPPWQQIGNCCGNVATVSYSIVERGYPGTGTLDLDPQFVDADGPDNIAGTLDDDLRLLPSSPAIDSGNNASVPVSLTTDLQGLPRFADVAAVPDTGAGLRPLVDMGAHEATFGGLYIAKSVFPHTSLRPGDPMTYVLGIENGSSLTTTGVVVTDIIPSFVTIPSVISSGMALTDTYAVPPFVWDVGQLAPGQVGLITITGVISPDLASYVTFDNAAEISSTSVETDTACHHGAVQNHVIGRIYVDRDAGGENDGTSWDDAFTSLQSALAVAAAGDEIWVAEGVYTPGTGSDRGVAFELRKGTRLYGGFAGAETSLEQRDWETYVTVLSGDLEGNDITANGIITDVSNIVGDNAYHVVRADGVTETSILDGFTITGGWADGAVGFHDNDGGGLYISLASNPTLSNLLVTGNYAEHGGGGMACVGSPTLSGTLFSGNHSQGHGGGLYTGSGHTLLLTNTLVEDNYAEYGGGGLYDWGGRLNLVGVDFVENEAAYGGGIDTWQTFELSMSGVRLIRNTARSSSGGGMSSWGNASLVNVLFSGNSALQGGAMEMWSEAWTVTLVNVTMSGNSASEQGGALHVRGDYDWPAVTNSILWGNTAPGGSQVSGRGAVVNHSLVQGSGGSGSGWDPSIGIDGGGNIDGDPLFVDPDGFDNITGTLDDDLRLAVPSPAIDAGDNTVVPAEVTLDLGGNPRFVDVPAVSDTGNGTPPIVDMGAYETVPVSDLQMTKDVTPAAVGPGQPITYTLNFANIGTEVITDTILITDSLPSEVVASGVISSGVVITKVQGGPEYIWQVGPMAAGEGGVITVSGYITLTVSGVFSLTNQATITAAEDEQMHNNASVVTNTVDAEAPQVEGVTPLSGTVDVPVNAPIVVTFTERVDPGTFGYVTTPDPGGWSEAWGSGGRVVTLTHTAFNGETVYTATVSGVDDRVGNPLENAPYSWSFVTAETVPPQIVGLSPPSGAVGVGLVEPVVITFSEEIDAGTFAYTVAPDPGGWAEMWGSGGEVVTLTHTTFDGKTTYTVTVSVADDLVGNPLAGGAHIWSFTTESHLMYLPIIMRDSGPFTRGIAKAEKQTSALVVGVSRGAVGP